MVSGDMIIVTIHIVQHIQIFTTSKNALDGLSDHWSSRYGRQLALACSGVGYLCNRRGDMELRWTRCAYTEHVVPDSLRISWSCSLGMGNGPYQIFPT